MSLVDVTMQTVHWNWTPQFLALDLKSSMRETGTLRSYYVTC